MFTETKPRADERRLDGTPILETAIAPIHIEPGGLALNARHHRSQGVHRFVIGLVRSEAEADERRPSLQQRREDAAARVQIGARPAASERHCSGLVYSGVPATMSFDLSVESRWEAGKSARLGHVYLIENGTLLGEVGAC
ncbi:hypothetical protein [Sorangium sp. So ce426]|uniref:hypothetical protein n=1 Tax=Sorangium sp. So ce426 TaxID=3133312 RepID=UPI003F5BE8AF